MFDLISELIALIQKSVLQKNALGIFALVMARMMALALIVPFLGGKNAPSQLKLGLGIMITILLFPAIAAGVTTPLPFNLILFVPLMLKEIFVGFCIGLVVNEIFVMVEISGQLIDMFRGVNQIQAMIPGSTDRSSAFGSLANQLMLVLFLSAGYHTVFFEALVESFRIVPVTEWPHFSHGFYPLIDELLHLLSRIFMIAVNLSLPVAVVVFVIDLAFGLMNKVAPQINAYFLAMPAKVLGGMVIFFAALDMTLSAYTSYGKELIQDLLRIIQLFA